MKILYMHSKKKSVDSKYARALINTDKVNVQAKSFVSVCYVCKSSAEFIGGLIQTKLT